MVAKERLGEEEVREEYRGKLNERLKEARTRVGEEVEFNPKHCSYV